MSSRADIIELHKDTFTALALEVWRLHGVLEKNKDNPDSVNLRYSIKKLKETLELEGCLYVDLTGQAYDAGMALDILGTEEDPTQPGESLIIKEMISPIILLKNALIRHGQAILAKGTLTPKEKDCP